MERANEKYFFQNCSKRAIFVGSEVWNRTITDGPGADCFSQGRIIIRQGSDAEYAGKG
jgi:hypothetical protein